MSLERDDNSRKGNLIFVEHRCPSSLVHLYVLEKVARQTVSVKRLIRIHSIWVELLFII